MTQPAVRVDPMENPEQANAQIAAILADESPEPEPKPTMEPPPDAVCTLPGQQIDVEVRELTGADEETLAKVQGQFGRWISTLLELAVEKVDGQPADEDSVGRLLVGDRDYLLLAIRRVTWGPEIELSLDCGRCGETFEAIVHVDDVPVRKLDKPDDASFTLDLRGGRKVSVRLPNGNDQAVYMGKDNASNAERNTMLLQRCVESITDANGVEMPVSGFPSMVRDMTIPDRTKLLREINNRMPGPRYSEVTVTHSDCGETTVVGIGPVALFPDLYIS